jgi:hypothetical protein
MIGVKENGMGDKWSEQDHSEEYAQQGLIISKETRRKLWEEWRPIINAIGEISVQEAMNAIEHTL